MKYRNYIFILISAVLFSVTGCGCPSSTSDGLTAVSANVKAAEGGILTDNTRITLDIPPGALTEDTKITVEEIGEDDWPDTVKGLEPEGDVIRLEPSGLQLDEPALITLTLDKSAISSTDTGQKIPLYTLVSVSEDGTQEYIYGAETRISGDGSITVSANISHFSWIVRQKSWFEVKLKEVSDEMEVDETFEVPIVLTNLAPETYDKQMTVQGILKTSENIEIDSRAQTYPRVIRWESQKKYSDHADTFGSDIENIFYLIPDKSQLFTWKLKGIKPGIGDYTMHLFMEEIPIEGKTRYYRLVLADAVRIINPDYGVTTSNGYYMQTYATQEKVAVFSWKFESEAGTYPSTDKIVCVKPVNLPTEFRGRYDSGEAIVEREILDKKADNMYISFDEEGLISFSLRTETPGEYAFEICGILSANYTDNKSYQGNGDKVVVKVPEPSEITGLRRECEEAGYVNQGIAWNARCYILKWHLFDDESDILLNSDIGTNFPVLTAPDGNEYSGLFLIMEDKEYIDRNPALSYNATSYSWAGLISGCGRYGNTGKCGYSDGILYHTLCLKPGDTISVSILDVDDDRFDYNGTGDPIVISYPSDDEEVIITYPD